jgi:hypothetical protein
MANIAMNAALAKRSSGVELAFEFMAEQDLTSTITRNSVIGDEGGWDDNQTHERTAVL